MPEQPLAPSPRPAPVDDRADAAEWVSAHLFYQGDLDRVLIDVVHPLGVELLGRGWTSGYFFLRYWEGGNHLRLRFLVPEADQREPARACIAAAAGQFFRAAPSPDVMHSTDYTELAQALASGERVPGYADTLYPNNSVAFLPYRREYHRYGRGTAMVAVEQHFVESSRLALDLLTSGITRARRDTLAYSLILVTWFVILTDDAQRAGWAAALLAVWEQSGPGLLGADTSDYGQRYDRQRRQLVALAANMLARAGSPAAGTDPQDVIAGWAVSIRRVREVLTEEIEAGRATPTERGFGAVPGTALNGPTSRVLPALDICAHLVCNRLGVSIPEEYYLRYLAARACAEICDQAR